MMITAKTTAVPPLLTTLLSWQELTGVLLEQTVSKSHAYAPALSCLVHNTQKSCKECAPLSHAYAT